MAAGWHSLPELNRAFAVGETAFLTARRREHDSRNKTARFSQAAEICIALSRKESMIFTVSFPLFNQIWNSNRERQPHQNATEPVPECFSKDMEASLFRPEHQLSDVSQPSFFQPLPTHTHKIRGRIAPVSSMKDNETYGHHLRPSS